MILALLMACYTEDDFHLEYAEAFCAKVFECVPTDEQQYLPYDDQAGCIERSTGGEDATDEDDESDCDFQPDLGRACVDEVGQMNCAQYEDGAFPESCNLVCAAPE